MIATFADVQVQYKPRTALYGRVLSTYDQWGKSRPTYNEWIKSKGINAKAGGLPDVWRFSELANSPPDYIDLTEDRQHYLLKINLEAFTGREYTRD